MDGAELELIAALEDHVFPSLNLNPDRRIVYIHILRHTRWSNRESALLKLSSIAVSTGMSTTTARLAVRDLASVGLIDLGTSRLGLSIALKPVEQFLPAHSSEMERVDIEQIDFFTSRKYVDQILVREQGHCFYCLRDLTVADCHLDHVVALAVRTDHSYRNVVAACFSCNTEKGSRPAEDFLRLLFRVGKLSDQELSERLGEVVALGEGLRPPILS